MIILRGLLKIFYCACAVIIFNGCNSDADLSLSTDKPLKKYAGSTFGQQFNDALLAEIYNQLGEPILAVRHYNALSVQIDDPAILQRATEIASKTGQFESGLAFSNKWFRLSPDSLEAGQYFALLLLRNEKFAQAADQLQVIRELVAKEIQSEGNKGPFDGGLRFIGSMLSVELHHEKSFIVFQHYLKKYGKEVHQTQENLILASLAMKAKKYEVVLSSFHNINNARTETIPEIVMMKAKALQKLERIGEAVKGLKSYVENNEASDSTKLELVRLLILDKQKESADNYLKDLVIKHPDNKDLLKSLIALEIDQSELEVAKNNIQKLKQSEGYRSDAEYFTGEVLEAEGDFKNAILSYKKVNKGILLKRAKKKILVLYQKLREIQRMKVNLKKHEADLVD